VTGREWIDAFARALGVESPDDTTVDTLLALAGEAAHSSERTAAPIACWLAARANVEPSAALDLATRVRTAE
jgi:uncharacterized protein DUF6457